MGKLGIILMTSPYEYENSNTVLRFVEAVLKKGHEIAGIFLSGDGVYNANKQIESPVGVNVAEEFKKMAAKGVRIVACSACSTFRGMPPSLLVEGVSLGGIGDLAEIIQQSDKVVTFSV